MPDGDRFRPSSQKSEQSSQPFFNFNIPGATNPAGGVARALNFARGMSRKAFVLVGVVAVAQWGLPENWKPSTIIGSFHGNTESAEYNAKKKAAAAYEAAIANVKVGTTTNWQIEGEVARQQQEALAKSLETQEAAAQLADAACIGSGFVTALFGDSSDTRNVRDAMQQACAAAAQIRANMARAQATTARDGSALMQRSAPGGTP